MGAGNSTCEVTFLNIMTIPSFLTKVLIDITSIAPKELGLLAVVSGKAFLLEIIPLVIRIL